MGRGFFKWQADRPRSKDSQNVTSCKHSGKITTTGQLFLLLYLTWFKCYVVVVVVVGGGGAMGVGSFVSRNLSAGVQSEHHSLRWQVFQTFGFQP